MKYPAGVSHPKNIDRDQIDHIVSNLEENWDLNMI